MLWRGGVVRILWLLQRTWYDLRFIDSSDAKANGILSFCLRISFNASYYEKTPSGFLRRVKKSVFSSNNYAGLG